MVCLFAYTFHSSKLLLFFDPPLPPVFLSVSLSDVRAIPMNEAPSFLFDPKLLTKEIRVRAGDPMEVKLPISGQPPPECIWELNGVTPEDAITDATEVGDELLRRMMMMMMMTDDDDDAIIIIIIMTMMVMIVIHKVEWDSGCCFR